MKATDIGIVLILAVICFIYFKGRKPAKPARTTQDLMNYVSISADGIVELPGREFRLVLEVEPVALGLKSPQEQAAAWLGFRSLLNSLTLPVTFLVQSRHLDLREYLALMGDRARNAPTAELREYGEKLSAWLQDLAEGRKVRDRRHYVIIRMGARDLEDYSSGVSVENEAVNAALKALTRAGGGMSEAEARDLARQELENMAAIVQAGLAALEIQSVRLNRRGVLELVYSTFNRDMANVVSVADADGANMFSLLPQSLTPHLEEVIGAETETKAEKTA